LSLKLAEEAFGKFTQAQHAVFVPEGFEDFVLVNKNYTVLSESNRDINDEVMWL